MFNQVMYKLFPMCLWKWKFGVQKLPTPSDFWLPGWEGSALHQGLVDAGGWFGVSIFWELLLKESQKESHRPHLLGCPPPTPAEAEKREEGPKQGRGTMSLKTQLHVQQNSEAGTNGRYKTPMQQAALMKKTRPGQADLVLGC